MVKYLIKKLKKKGHKEYDEYMKNHLTQVEKDYLEIINNEIKNLDFK